MHHKNDKIHVLDAPGHL